MTGALTVATPLFIDPTDLLFDPTDLVTVATPLFVDPTDLVTVATPLFVDPTALVAVATALFADGTVRRPNPSVLVTVPTDWRVDRSHKSSVISTTWKKSTSPWSNGHAESPSRE